MSDQPEVLRLADEVDEVAQTYPDMAEVSAELRRLHDHNQMLEHAYKSACDIVEEQDKKLAQLEAVNAELLKALRVSALALAYATETAPVVYEDDYNIVSAAIAKAEEQK